MEKRSKIEKHKIIEAVTFLPSHNNKYASPPPYWKTQ
jgi:hypothetical protein